MAGIAGIARQDAEKEVNKMLEALNHRGTTKKIVRTEGTTMGIIWHDEENESITDHLKRTSVGYEHGPGNYAIGKEENGRLILYRDELGVSPLYAGYDKTGSVCFSSEVKALLPIAENITEIPAGHTYNGEEAEQFFRLRTSAPVDEDPGLIAAELRCKLDDAVKECIKTNDYGAWLSGGLDSSVICTLASKYIRNLKTFTAGLKGAPDIEYARETARFLKTDHHEVIVTINDLIDSLPEVIYYLESFDALLVRSSIINYVVAREASGYVSDAFSGEGGDELFAGYEYLKNVPYELLDKELIRITKKLHNTALQRVDRCASAHGIVTHTIFTNPEIVRYAFTIPSRFKIRNNIEKWILRRALEGFLPDNILYRPKAKFWEGAGVKDLISEYADTKISDKDFTRERMLPNGWIINSKEELYYYRIFRKHFGTDTDLSWMGRTDNSPVS